MEEKENRTNKLSNIQESVMLWAWLLHEASRCSVDSVIATDCAGKPGSPTPPATWNGEDKEPFPAWIINNDAEKKEAIWSRHQQAALK